MSEYKLTEEIIKRSRGQTWDAARREWRLADVYCVAGATFLGVLHEEVTSNEKDKGD